MYSDTVYIPTRPLQRSFFLHTIPHLFPALDPPSQSTILLRIPPHLPPGPARGQKRLLPRTQNPIPLPLPFPLDIPRRDMLDSAIVPDGDIPRSLPANACLDIMVLGDEVFNHGPEPGAFVLGDAHEPAAVHPAREDGVPARNGVRADGGVDGVETEADVGGGAARARVGALAAAGLGVVRVAPLDLQVLEQLLERLAHPVVEIVGAGVEGVSARGGDLAQAQGGVVAWVFFE